MFNYPHLLFYAGIAIIGYLFFIRPAQQEDQQKQTFLDNLTIGQKIITSSGIHGTIMDIAATTVVLSIDQRASLVLDKTAIAFEHKQKDPTVQNENKK